MASSGPSVTRLEGAAPFHSRRSFYRCSLPFAPNTSGPPLFNATVALAISFPFNIIFGLPLYLWAVERLWN